MTETSGTPKNNSGSKTPIDMMTTYKRKHKARLEMALYLRDDVLAAKILSEKGAPTYSDVELFNMMREKRQTWKEVG